MKAEKVICMAVALSLVLMQTAASAVEISHKHIWVDDVKNSDEYTNRYYCDCGARKDEDIASIRDYTIRFDANGGVVDVESMVTKDNKIKKLPIPHRDSDYQFEGWYTDKNGSEEVTDKWIYEEDTTLYAGWSVVGTYTLTFASDEGSYIKPITEKYGTVIDLEKIVPKREGYIFKGWYLDPQTKEKQVTKYTINENGTVYAKWLAKQRNVQSEMLFTIDPIYLTDEQTAERTELIRTRMMTIIQKLIQIYYK